jgi:hypothetical protein
MEEALARGRGSITPRLMAALNDKVVSRFRTVEPVILVIIIVFVILTTGCVGRKT